MLSFIRFHPRKECYVQSTMKPRMPFYGVVVGGFIEKVCIGVALNML